MRNSLYIQKKLCKCVKHTKTLTLDSAQTIKREYIWNQWQNVANIKITCPLSPWNQCWSVVCVPRHHHKTQDEGQSDAACLVSHHGNWKWISISLLPPFKVAELHYVHEVGLPRSPWGTRLLVDQDDDDVEAAKAEQGGGESNLAILHYGPKFMGDNKQFMK